MAKTKRLIFEINKLHKNYGSYSALKLKKLDIHPGTIYGVVGPIGSGKTTLLNLLAGFDKQSSGSLLYEGNAYEKSWLGKVKQKQSVFSSIDQMGRYAYCNQPVITKWNLSRFAECLIPLIDKDQNKAIELATEIINSFEKKY